MRIETQTGIVYEYLVVNIANIDLDSVAQNDRLHRVVKIKRQLQVFSKVIQGPKWQHTKCPGSSYERRSDGANGPIATAGYYCLVIVFYGALRQFQNFWAISRDTNFPMRTGRQVALNQPIDYVFLVLGARAGVNNNLNRFS